MTTEKSSGQDQTDTDLKHSIPKKIYFFWKQGRQNAPSLAHLCWRQWQEFNPDFEIQILTVTDAYDILQDMPIALDHVHPAALSDMVRIELLASRGGIWCDSSVIPSRALSAWLPEAMGTSDFFGFKRSQAIRPIGSWFLASKPGSIIAARWRDATISYWSTERPPNPNYFGANSTSLAAFRSMGFDGGKADQRYPYFWFHHLLGNLIVSDIDVQSEWNAMNSFRVERCTYLDRCMRSEHSAPRTLGNSILKRALDFGLRRPAIFAALRQAPVHKLSFKRTYRPSSLQHMKNYLSDLQGQRLSNLTSSDCQSSFNQEP